MTPEQAMESAKNDFAGWAEARQANRVLAAEVERLQKKVTLLQKLLVSAYRKAIKEPTP